jgi:RecB family exonuclease
VNIAELIHRNLSDSRRVFVFPAEISARFWLKKSLAFAPTLDARRFLSWDQFKKTAFCYPAAGKAATAAVRTLFIAGFLEQNRRQGRLETLIPPDHAGNSPAFQQSLERILPTLHRLREIPSLAAGKKRDLDLLFREYTALLAREKLFEPGYTLPEFIPGGRRYLLFFPDVIQDYSLYDGLLAREAGITTVSPPPRGADTPLLAFENSDEELRWLLLRIAALLDAGVDAQEIVVSAASLETLEDPLRRGSLLYEIPLRFHGARALAGYPEARFFTSLAECAASGFALEPCQALLLDHALPWRDRSLARRLIRFGSDYRLISAAGEKDLWQSAFRRAARSGTPPGELAALRAFYSKLSARCLGIVGAGSFARLKEALAAFTGDLFSAPEWSATGKKRFEYALRVLDELMEAEPHLPGCPRPFALWQNSLRQRPYVARESGGGIAVYPYRVASGIYPDYHFIINASQQATRHVVKRLPFLSLDEEELMAGAEQDFSPHHIDLYAASGRNVSFSYARGGLESSQLPPASFVIRGRIIDAADQRRLLAADPYGTEQAAWAGAEFPAAVFQLQRQGFAAAERSVLLPRTRDYAAGAPADPVLAAALAAEMADSAGFLRITPTALEAFRGCAFRFLLQRGAGIEELEYRPPLFTPRESGELMHRIFQVFNQELMRRRLEMRVENLPLFAELLTRALAAAAAGYARSRPLPPRPVWRLLLDRIGKLIRGAVELECHSLPGQELLFAEHRLELRRNEDRVLLSGKIDRISRLGGEQLLLDYKKNRLPSPADIFGDDPVSFQMPFYIHLMRENDLPVSRALYYSLEQQSLRPVFSVRGKSMTDPEGLESCLAGLAERIGEMARGIRGGLYPAASEPEGRKCGSCGFRGVCRERYALRSAEKRA